MQLVYSKCSHEIIDLMYLVEYGPPLATDVMLFFFIFPPGILTGGIPLSFPLLAAVGVPLNIAVSSSQPIEVTCNGTEGSIQQCQIIRLLQPSAGTIAGVNCTGVCINYIQFKSIRVPEHGIEEAE